MLYKSKSNESSKDQNMVQDRKDDGLGFDCTGQSAAILFPASVSGVSINLTGLVGFSDPAGANFDKSL